MGKTIDSSSKSSPSGSSVGSGSPTTTASNSGNEPTTIVCSETNEKKQILPKHQHIHYNTKNSIMAASNQVKNSLGCGPPSATTAPQLSSLAKAVAPTNTVVGGCSNLNSNNIMSSLNNATTNGSTTATSRAISSSVTPLTNSISNSPSSQMAPINLNISTTTGGSFSVPADPSITVENLKKIIAKRLKVAKERICLLHREKELQDGSLKDNNIMDGSKIILIPNVETGLLVHRPENTVLQALEALNDSQVNDFLSGKTPLNLSMRLGDHMMLIQLQLSTVNPVNGTVHNGTTCSSSSSRQRTSHHNHHHHRSSRSAAITSATAQTAGAATAANHNHNHHHHHHHHQHHHGSNSSTAGSATTNTILTPTSVSVATTAQNVENVRKLELSKSCPCNRSNAATLITPSSITTTGNVNGATSTTMSTSTMSKNANLGPFLSKCNYESLQNIVKSIAMSQPSRVIQQSITTNNVTNSSAESPSIVLPVASKTSLPGVTAPSFHAASETVLLEQSPIKSLSNLVSSPIKTTPIKNIPKMSNNTNSSSTNNSVALGPHTTSILNGPTSNLNASITTSNSVMCQDPIAAKLTSCLCTRLNTGGLGMVNNTPHNSAKQCIETACVSQQQLQRNLLHQLHHHRHQQLQPHATLASTSTSTIMASTSNYKETLTPNSITTTFNGSTNSSSPSSPTSRSSSNLHKTAHNPISRKHRHHQHHHYHNSDGVELQTSISNNQKAITNTSTPVKIVASNSSFNSSGDTLLDAPSTNSSSASSVNQSPATNLNTSPATAAAAAEPNTSSSLPTSSNANLTTSSTNTGTSVVLGNSGIVSDSRTLAEASRNLTQTLRKLSKEVFTNKIDFMTTEEASRKIGSGAVIESMKNHGRGIYSGTFSGTLNPALQDRYGRPKRDISTVIHILNDLLSATPQYNRGGARISLEAPSTSAAAASSVAAASGSTGTVHHSSRSKHLSSKHQSSHSCVRCIKTHNSTSSVVNLQSSSTSNASGCANSHSSSTSSSVCVYGECNGHYASSKSQSTKIYSCCQHDVNITATSTSSIPSAAKSTAIASSEAHKQLANANSNSSANTTPRTTNGHHQHHHHHVSSHHHHHHHHHQVVDERKVCQCRYRVHSESGERERDYTCQKCIAELDNIKTKSKLDQLRLVMQQRKQKREARKLKGAPYGARVVGTTTTAASSAITEKTASTLTTSNSTISTTVSTTSTPPSEVSPNHIVEEVDTAA